ncbi:hypothetical protein [Cellulosimicrobium cellulans]|uniref:hypothetical protein n=1 Tax=Cellulosimicrobium cellulans TaxID=1710 RepID=UPI000848820B|nr:hypothetical protein [Cellulosimicrobium cellulans]
MRSRPLHLLPTAVLVAAALSACTSGPPTNASIDDFCAAMEDYWVSAESTDVADHVRAAESLSVVGTPEGSPDYAVRTAALLGTWLESDRGEDEGFYAGLSSDERWDLRDTDLWAQVTCSTGELGDIEDHPSYQPRS